MIQRNANTYHYLCTTGVVWNDNQIMNYIDFRFASGNIAAGTIKAVSYTHLTLPTTPYV